MLYVSLTLWLLVIVGLATGICHIWTRLVKPRMFNILLLPGTLVAQLGHILGLLVTGAKVRDAQLIKDDESGEPATTSDPEPKIPVVGPVVIGMLPLVACAVAVYFVAVYLGAPVRSGISGKGVIDGTLPTSLGAFFTLLRSMVSQVESLVVAVTKALAGTPNSWRVWLFVYLLLCLTVRMAPLPGNLKGSIGAILVLGIGAAAVASLFGVPDPRLATFWQVMNLALAELLLIMMVSLVVLGIVKGVRAVRGSGGAPGK